jgi:hypothetical protein
MTLHISHQHDYDGPCPRPVEVTAWDDLAKGERHWLCGCGFCPQPDPTPAELQRRVDDAAWRRATTLEET